jgi:hypothetical protein
MRGFLVNEASNVSTRKTIVATTKIQGHSTKGPFLRLLSDRLDFVAAPMESGQFMIASSCLSSI